VKLEFLLEALGTRRCINMGKISPVSAKYIVHANIEIDGVVDRPDVIGAIFGQTEGLLGSDLELRELQRNGRIGRIEVNVETRTGKTRGSILIPSSLDKAETAIVSASLEIIQRIGPCNAKIKVEKIEDVRVSKRQFVVGRAKELLKLLMDSMLPETQELADEVANSVRVMEITEYGKDRLAAGPVINESDEIIIVEGRADVVNLLKHGFKNAIAVNGTNIPETIIELCKKKTATVFVDGDRGGNLIVKELLNVTVIDFVTKAPDGKEVEEITKKEIHTALRSRISAEQASLDFGKELEEVKPSVTERRPVRDDRSRPQSRFQARRPVPPPAAQAAPAKKPPSSVEVKAFRAMLEDLIGTRGAYVLDEKLSILAKVPSTELDSTISSSENVYAIVFDGEIDRNLTASAEKNNVTFVVGMDSKVQQRETKLALLTVNDL